MSKYSIENPKQLADTFKALSNPNRLQIYLLLSNCCTPGTVCTTDDARTCCVGDLGANMDIALSTLSHHLKELHRAGLINMQRKGKQVECSINPDMVKTLANFFNPV